jgi:hypothetical protein
MTLNELQVTEQEVNKLSQELDGSCSGLFVSLQHLSRRTDKNHDKSHPRGYDDKYTGADDGGNTEPTGYV